MANTPAFRGWQHPWSLILLPVGGSSSVARRADRRAAVDMSTATTTAACTRARAARAHYTLQQGPRSTKRAPSTAIEFQRARLRVGKTAFTSTTMWRMFAARTGGPRALARSRRRARAAATSRVTGPVLAASSTSEMLYRSQWSRSGLSECIHVWREAGQGVAPVWSEIQLNTAKYSGIPYSRLPPSWRHTAIQRHTAPYNAV